MCGWNTRAHMCIHVWCMCSFVQSALAKNVLHATTKGSCKFLLTLKVELHFSHVVPEDLLHPALSKRADHVCPKEAAALPFDLKTLI